MGSIRRVVHGSGQQAWQARWRDPAGIQRSKNFRRRIDAERHLTAVESEIHAGTYVDSALGKILFDEWLPQAEAARINRRPSTKARDESYFRNLVVPTFGPIPLGSVQPVHVQRWVAGLAEKEYAPATIRKAYQLLCRTFDSAVQSGVILRNPCRGVQLPASDTAEMRFLSPTEIQQLADAISPRFKALVLTGAYTGARFGELAALHLDDFNTEGHHIQIVRSLSEVNGHIYFGEPKTRAARRRVTLPAWLTRSLEQHLEEWPPPDEGLVFTSPGGGALRRSFRRRYWKPAVRDSVGEPMRFHDLRHSHVALLIEQGTHPAVIAARLGHTSVKTVLDVYGHLYEGLDRQAAEGLEAPWSATMTSRRPPDRGAGGVSIGGI
jgi:integrase